MVLEGLENFLARLGLGDPAVRFVAASLVAAGAFWLLKPKLMFNAQGKPRPFGEPGLMDPNQKDRPTLVTWWVGAMAVGGVMALFI